MSATDQPVFIGFDAGSGDHTVEWEMRLNSDGSFTLLSMREMMGHPDAITATKGDDGTYRVAPASPQPEPENQATASMRTR
jgi:hypothetical protein